MTAVLGEAPGLDLFSAEQDQALPAISSLAALGAKGTGTGHGAALDRLNFPRHQGDGVDSDTCHPGTTSLFDQFTHHLSPIGPRLCTGLFVHHDDGLDHEVLLRDLAVLSPPESASWPLDNERRQAPFNPGGEREAPIALDLDCERLAKLTARGYAMAAGEALRSPERRAAAHAWVSLATSPTLAAARRAACTFGDRATQDAALALIGKLTAE